MRAPADRAKIDRLLSALGDRVRGPAKVVITGGASMILRGLRNLTLDVDLTYEVAPERDSDFATALRQLKESLAVNIELADPSHFIPMPSGRDRRLEFLGRFGETDVFLDDPYAIALSKLDRGREKDLEDVHLLAGRGFITYEELEAKAREIAAPGTRGGLRVDLERLLVRLARVRRG